MIVRPHLEFIVRQTLKSFWDGKSPHVVTELFFGFEDNKTSWNTCQIRFFPMRLHRIGTLITVDVKS